MTRWIRQASRVPEKSISFFSPYKVQNLLPERMLKSPLPTTLCLLQHLRGSGILIDFVSLYTLSELLTPGKLIFAAKLGGAGTFTASALLAVDRDPDGPAMLEMGTAASLMDVCLISCIDGILFRVGCSPAFPLAFSPPMLFLFGGIEFWDESRGPREAPWDLPEF